MKLFLDRNKTLLPRIDVIYLLSRVMTLLAVGWFTAFGDYPKSDAYVFHLILATLGVHLFLFYLAVKGKLDIKLAYLSSILFDILMVPLLILFTGMINSPFYLLFFLTISVSAYVLTFWYSAASVVIVALSYLWPIYPDLTVDTAFAVSLRIGSILVYYLAIFYASDYMRRSERRLLKLFDTLNMRTSELEKSQAQLELIYENSRALAAILDADGVVHEVTKIIANTLQYSCYSMILTDRKGTYYHRARYQSGEKNFSYMAIEIETMELVHKVCEIGEPIRVKNIAGRDDYRPLGSGSRSVLIVPMVSHGQIMGVLTAESTRTNHFGERDIQMLSIVARSAALALENAELHKRTEELTIIDELTETYNYRYFIQKLSEETRRAERYTLPLSLIMVDIDWFKKLNDSFGHEAGNRVLKQLPKVIQTCVRDVDIFARYGGEEFVIILPQTPKAEAVHIGERIRSKVEEAVFDLKKIGNTKITVSVGVSSYPENGRSHEELVGVTDEALYRAKGDGRNLVASI
ncbi:MAG: sensor domain-containing diguanylate cyclase [Candidatus Zixiibacteriota bacterium]